MKRLLLAVVALLVMSSVAEAQYGWGGGSYAPSGATWGGGNYSVYGNGFGTSWGNGQYSVYSTPAPRPTVNQQPQMTPYISPFTGKVATRPTYPVYQPPQNYYYFGW